MSSSLDAIEAERRVIQLITDYSESGFGEEIFYTNYGDEFSLTMSCIRVGDLIVKLLKTEKSEKNRKIGGFEAVAEWCQLGRDEQSHI